MSQSQSSSIVTSPGFTLIEILIALFIFAIMGVLAAMSLHAIIRTHERLKQSDQQLLQLQVTMALLRRDISEVIDRPIRDDNDDQAPAFVASGNTDIVFTRTGLFNMHRIGYVLQKNKFVRLTWDVLDQAPKSKVASQIILNNVKSLEWQFISDKGKKSSVWPPPVGSNMQAENQSSLPKVVLMVMMLKNNDVIQGVFPIPARGNYASPP